MISKITLALTLAISALARISGRVASEPAAPSEAADSSSVVMIIAG